MDNKKKDRVTDILREYANALQSDWEKVDVRVIRQNINEMATDIDMGIEYLTRETATLRRFVYGLCLNRKGCWQNKCGCCDEMWRDDGMLEVALARVRCK